MKQQIPVGIISYGCYIPRYRFKTSVLSEVWGESLGPIPELSIPGPDEDTITMAIEASSMALRKIGLDPKKIRAVWVGTESKPYAVKPSSTIVAEAIGATPDVSAADFEFACKAGTEAMQTAAAFVGSGMAEYALAIGMDTAQSKPGDTLEFTAGAGGAAFIFGKKEESIAWLEESYSYVTDTPDFFRRANLPFPEHGGRFTGEPAYFTHLLSAARKIMEITGLSAKDFDYAVFHQPNPKFPSLAGKMLGFKPEQIEPGLLSPYIGNTYAGSSLIGMAATLDVAKPGQRILMVSFGSGAGSDAFVFTVTDKIEALKGKTPPVKSYLNRRKEVNDYGLYAIFQKKIKRG